MRYILAFIACIVLVGSSLAQDQLHASGGTSGNWTDDTGSIHSPQVGAFVDWTCGGCGTTTTYTWNAYRARYEYTADGTTYWINYTNEDDGTTSWEKSDTGSGTLSKTNK